MSNYKLRTLKGEMDGVDSPMSTTEAFLPSFSVTEKDLPEIKNWSVGGKYRLEVEVEMVSSSKNEYGKSPLNARLKIRKIGTEEEDLNTVMAKRGHF